MNWKNIVAIGGLIVLAPGVVMVAGFLVLAALGPWIIAARWLFGV